MLFVETPIFTRLVRRYLADDEYRLLQAALAIRPQEGAVIPGTGGLRKIRWGAEGRGKSGGLRVIYYWVVDRDTILMLYLYDKAEQDDLSPSQTRALAENHRRGVFMKKELFDELLESVRQGGSILKGEARPSRKTEIATPDVRAIRAGYRLSQVEFARLIGISTATLRNWEQGRRRPEGPAQVLLKVAAKHPDAVLDAVHGGARPSRRKRRPLNAGR